MPATEDPQDGDVWGHFDRRKFVQRAAVAGGLLGLPAVLAQQGLSAINAAAPRRGGHFIDAETGGGTSESINPFIQNQGADQIRLTQLYDQLFIYRKDRTGFKPQLAQSLVPNAKGTVWQLKLKKGVTFHNGKSFGADDVLYSWKWIKNPKNGSTGAVSLEPFDLRATKKVSNSEIEIHLTRPVGDLAAPLADFSLKIVPDGFTDFKHPIGTGPFRFVSFTPGQRSLFRRNDEYWGTSGPYFDEVEILSIPDNAARLNALLSGQIHAMSQLGYAQARSLRGNSNVRLLVTHMPYGVTMAMRTDTPPFNDVRVRQAFRLAVDRKQMVSNVFQGFGTLGNDEWGKGFLSYNSSLPQRMYDPEKAKALLAKAGKSDLRVTLYSSDAYPGILETATLFKQQAAAAGINVAVNRLPSGNYFDPTAKYNKRSAPFYQDVWAQPWEYVARLTYVKGAPYNITAWNHPEWQTRFRKAQGVTNAQRRNAAYRSLQEELYAEGGNIVGAFGYLLDGLSSRIRGATPGGFVYMSDYQIKDWWFAT